MNISRRPLLLYALRLGRIVRTSRPHPILSSLKLRSTDSLEVHFSSSTQENNNKQKAPIFREVDEHGFQIPIEDSTRYTDEEKAHRKKMARQYSLLIASLIGFISSSFLLYKRMLNVEAKFVEDGAATRSEDHAGQEDSDSGKKEEEIALHKSKAGFRERKVKHGFENFLLWKLPKIWYNPPMCVGSNPTLRHPKSGQMYFRFSS